MAPTIFVLVMVSLIGLILGIEKRPRGQAVRVTVKKK